MFTREQIPSLFVELQKLADSNFLWNDSSCMTRREVSGLSLYEDDDCLYLEAPVPGIKADQIQINIEKGLVWIKAEAPAIQQKDKKVHFTSERSYSYRIPLPMRIDEQSTPEAICQDGILKIKMAKSRACKPIKITVKNNS